MKKQYQTSKLIFVTVISCFVVMSIAGVVLGKKPLTAEQMREIRGGQVFITFIPTKSSIWNGSSRKWR